MRLYPVFYGVLLFLAACNIPSKSSTPHPKYPDQVGDIAPDPLLDDPAFRACRETNIPQYYAVNGGYEGEKPALERYFKENYKKDPAFAGENGYIIVRFVVNCSGQTGRFRVQEMDADYRPKKFPAALSAQLRSLCMQMKNWLPGKNGAIPYDYYQYLCFTIVNGDIERITP